MAVGLPELKKQIKENKIGRLYLFYGDEQYLIDFYTDKISQSISDGGVPEFNRMVVEDAKAPLADISDFIDTYPMMCERKLLIMRGSGIFKSAAEEVRSFWKAQLSDIPDYITIIFAESETDKRSVLYKEASKLGTVVEFSKLSDTDAVLWAERAFRSKKRKITKSNAEYLVSVCGSGLLNLKNETEKLSDYCDGEITRSDIDRLVSKSLDIRVFEITDAIIAHDADKALSILSDMKTVRESAFKILYILFSAFDKLLYAELLQKEGEPMSEIAKKLKVPPFIAKKYMNKNFGEDFLAECVMKIAETDLAIKEGRIDEWSALEQFVAGLFV